MTYNLQDPNSPWARHDVGKDPEPYTIDEVLKTALRNEDGEILANVYGKGPRYISNSFHILDEDFDIDDGTDPATVRAIATNNRGGKVPAILDPKEGVWFKDE